MVAWIGLLFRWLASFLKSHRRLQAENMVLGHQLNIVARRPPRRLRLSLLDRLVFVWLYRLCPAVLDAVAIIRPETLIRWHRQGIRAYWRWKSRSRAGRPSVSQEIRELIPEMSRANCLLGAPRIHGELLKLGIEIAQSTVSSVPDDRGRGGIRSCATTRTGLRQPISSSCPRSASNCSMAWSSWLTGGEG